MHITSGNRLFTILGRTAAVTFLAAAGTMGLQAQQSAGTVPAVNFKASLATPMNLSIPDDPSSSSSSYSSSVGTTETANAVSFLSTSDDTQPPPRRSYHRPNYNDSRTNADGSPKYFFQAGGGFGVPTGGTHNYLTTGWGLQVGGGRNFNKKLGVGIQFDYDHFGFQTGTLNNLLAIYQTLGVEDGFGDGGTIQQLGGTTHIWSFTVDPRYTFYDGDKYGAYVVGGLGFYHKAANFTTPGVGTYCTFYGCFEVQANQTIDTYTSNAFGLNGGVGFTYKFSRFTNQRLYAEARYVWTDNQPRPYFDGTTGTPLSSTYFNVFPQNSARTTYIPVKFGIRF
jgi:hypothetical protein